MTKSSGTQTKITTEGPLEFKLLLPETLCLKDVNGIAQRVEGPLQDAKSTQEGPDQQSSSSSTISLHACVLNQADEFLANLHNLTKAKPPAPEPQQNITTVAAHLFGGPFLGCWSIC